MVDIVTLPGGLQWFEVAGQKVFPVYGASGGISAEFIAILFDSNCPPLQGFDLGLKSQLENDERGKWFVIRFGVIEDHHSVTAKFREAFEAMNGN